MKVSFIKKMVSTLAAATVLMAGTAFAAEAPEALSFDQSKALEVKTERIENDTFDTLRNNNDPWDGEVYYMTKGDSITLTKNEAFNGKVFSITVVDLTAAAAAGENTEDAGVYTAYSSDSEAMEPVTLTLDNITSGDTTFDFGNTEHLYAIKAGLNYTAEEGASAGDYFHVAYIRVVAPATEAPDATTPDADAPETEAPDATTPDAEAPETEAPKAEVVLPATATAVPSAAKILVNGKEVAFDAYNINNNNYFKLRDVAMAINGTEKQFAVTWDNEVKAINLLFNQAYTAAGTELAQGDGTQKAATLNTAKVYLNGSEISVAAYTINSNNYFKLRDLGQTFNFGVNWDNTAKTISVDTTASYVAE